MEIELNCPYCNSEYLSLIGESSYFRKENAQQVTRFTRTGPQMTVEAVLSNEAGNPSERRSGVAITFCCEQCGGNPELYFAEHKGIMLTGWRDGSLTV